MAGPLPQCRYIGGTVADLGQNAGECWSYNDGAVSCTAKQTSCAPINSLLVFDAHYGATKLADATLAFAAATDTVNIAAECVPRRTEIYCRKRPFTALPTYDAIMHNVR